MLLAYNLYKEDVTRIYAPATGIEVYHNYTLLHDDLMDRADRRRGKETVHKVWNDNTAILSGDAMLVLAYQFMAECPSTFLKEVMDLFHFTGTEKICGEDRIPFQRNSTALSAIAAIYSGTTPSMNGIISQYWMDASTLRPVNCVDDGAFMGNFTDENSSPSQLLTSTIADELKVATRNKGLVYAIAPSRDAAVLAAGHTGNANMPRSGMKAY